MSSQETVTSAPMANNGTNNTSSHPLQSAKCQATIFSTYFPPMRQGLPSTTVYACNHTWTPPIEHQINCPGIPSGQKSCNNIATQTTERNIDRPCNSWYGPCASLARAKKAADNEERMEEQRKQEREADADAKVKKAKDNEASKSIQTNIPAANNTDSNYKDRDFSIPSNPSTLGTVQRMMEERNQDTSTIPQAQKFTISQCPVTKGIHAKLQPLHQQRKQEYEKKERDFVEFTASFATKYDGQDTEEEWEDISVDLATGIKSIGLDDEDWVMA